MIRKDGAGLRPKSVALPVAVGAVVRPPWSDPVIGETREGWSADAGPQGPKRASQNTDDARKAPRMALYAGRRREKNGRGVAGLRGFLFWRPKALRENLRQVRPPGVVCARITFARYFFTYIAAPNLITLLVNGAGMVRPGGWRPRQMTSR